MDTKFVIWNVGKIALYNKFYMMWVYNYDYNVMVDHLFDRLHGIPWFMTSQQLLLRSFFTFLRIRNVFVRIHIPLFKLARILILSYRILIMFQLFITRNVCSNKPQIGNIQYCRYDLETKDIRISTCTEVEFLIEVRTRECALYR
jgi:hypothetical protein